MLLCFRLRSGSQFPKAAHAGSSLEMSKPFTSPWLLGGHFRLPPGEFLSQSPPASFLCLWAHVNAHWFPVSRGLCIFISFLIRKKETSYLLNLKLDEYSWALVSCLQHHSFLYQYFCLLHSAESTCSLFLASPAYRFV